MLLPGQEVEGASLALLRPHLLADKHRQQCKPAALMRNQCGGDALRGQKWQSTLQSYVLLYFRVGEESRFNHGPAPRPASCSPGQLNSIVHPLIENMGVESKTCGHEKNMLRFAHPHRHSSTSCLAFSAAVVKLRSPTTSSASYVASFPQPPSRDSKA